MITLLLAAGEAAAEAGKAAVEASPEGGSGLHNFLEIVTKPDNIPIVAMFFIVMYFFGLCIRMGRENDRLTESGEHDKIYEKMNRWVFGGSDEEKSS